MAKSCLLSAGADLIAQVQSLLPEKKESLARSLVVFPGRRPAHFLRKALAVSLGGSYEPPAIYSQDGFVDFLYARAGHQDRALSDLDGVALLYELHRTLGMPGARAPLPLDLFLPWGFKLLKDLEELRIELVDAGRLEGLESLAGSRVPVGLQGILAGLSKICREFYSRISQSGLSTRSSRYAAVAGEIEELDLSEYHRLILAGFFGLTRSEARMVRSLAGRANVQLLFQDGPGIGEVLKDLGLEPETLGAPEPHPEVFFHQAADRHGEVMALAKQLGDLEVLGEKQVIVLPSSPTLFPVVQQVLSRAPGDYNISLDYPLLRTPVYALLETLAGALEKAEDGRYFVPDYLGLVLHPYIKNLFLDGQSSHARIIWHTIEEKLNDQGARFVSLAEIEARDDLLEECRLKLLATTAGGLDHPAIRAYIGRVHGILLRPFERLLSISDFCGKLMALLSLVSEESPANDHPYTGRFIQAALLSLDGLAHSALAREKLPRPGDYFQFLRTVLPASGVHFPGTPLQGLQVLGFLETRNLKFEEVFLLDLDEGVLPATGTLDSLLPLAMRKHLGLATYTEREQIQRYHFHTLLRGCRRAHLFFIQSDDQQRSRLVEELLWQEQKNSGRLAPERFDQVYFPADFHQSEPDPAAKTQEVIHFLQSHRFSPSSLDEYLHCPLQFYYRRVLRLDIKDELTEGMEASEIGGIVHDILQGFFSKWEGRELHIGAADEQRLLALTRTAFEGKMGPDLAGSAYLIQSQVLTRMHDILQAHQQDPYRGALIRSCELRLSQPFDFGPGQEVRMGGKIDRVDERDGEIVILDYKTGSQAILPSKTRFDLAARRDWPRTLRSVQVPLYLLLYLAQYPGTDASRLNGSLMMLRQKPIKEEFLFRDGSDRGKALGEYRQAVATLVSEILDPGLPFHPTSLPQDNCPRCTFKVFCGRQWMDAKQY